MPPEVLIGGRQGRMQAILSPAVARARGHLSLLLFMFQSLLRVLIFLGASSLTLGLAAAPAFEDTMAQRTLACTACHGAQGRAGPDGYYPRLAGKPAGYLYNQLLNFREGRRHYGLMAGLVEPLTDSYLWDMAQYFSQLDLPYPLPSPASVPAPVLARGKTLALEGDAKLKIPACALCHGSALTGASPNVPGLLGLPRDYLSAQLGGWQTRQRRAHAPDCMAHIATQLSGADVAAVTSWLSAQVLPRDTRPLAALPTLPAGVQRPDCGSAPAPIPTTVSSPAPLAPAANTLVSQGAYLARAGNCMGCHTVRGGTPYAGGRGIATPFGTVYSSNLTSDKATGLGAWSTDDFWQALHHGRSKDGRLLNPAFPYTSYNQVTRSDADALFAYLQTLPATRQTNQAHALRWPLGTQAALRVWRTLYFKPQDFAPDASQSASWNRGAYLVNGLGHCAACHTPRNALGASIEKRSLSGSLMPLKDWYAPSLRSSLEAGVADWSVPDIVSLLQTGVSPHGSSSGPMAEVVQGSTQYLSASDLNGMAVYLKSLGNPTLVSGIKKPAAAPAPTATALVPSLGGKLYETHCVNCHGAQGAGVRGAYPALAHNRTVTMGNTTNLVQTVLYGGFAPATAGNPQPFGMPPYILQLNDKETAAVLTHIRQSWGNQAPEVTELDINRARDRQAH